MAVEQDIWFAWHISRGAILKLFEPVEGRNTLDGFFFIIELNSSLQRDESVARWGDAVVWSELHPSIPWSHASE